MDERGVSKHSRGEGSLNLPSLLVVLWIFRRFKKRDDPGRPQIVSHSPQSKAVLDRAKQLARDGREDPSAIAELRALAGGRRRTLRQAERTSRFAGYHRELRQANLANRLLRAAVARAQAPAALTAGEEKRIDAIEDFKQLSATEQWGLLVDTQPALRTLEADVRNGRFGEVTGPPGDLAKRGTRTYETVDGEPMVKVTFSSSDPPPTPEETRRLKEFARAHMRLTSELQSLVGPRAGQLDPVLGSQQALDTAERHLRRPAAGQTAIADVPLT